MTSSIVNRLLSVVVLSIVMFSCNEYKNENSKMKKQDEKTELGLKKALNRLIEPDESFGIAQLDAIYHDDMIVIMIDPNDNKTIFKKEAFKK